MPPVDAPNIYDDTNPGFGKGEIARTPWLKSLWDSLVQGPAKKSFDWREHGLTFEVRDQREWSLCSSFAMAAMVESRRSLKGISHTRLSAGFIPFCLLGATDVGRRPNPPAVAGKAQTDGFRASQDDGPPLDHAACQIVPAEMIRIASSGYGSRGAVVADRMATHGPLLLEIFVPKTFFSLGKHEVFDFDPEQATELHSLLMIAYDWPGKTVTVLNSQGNAFGNAGFANLSLGAAQLDRRNPFEVQV